MDTERPHQLCRKEQTCFTRKTNKSGVLTLYGTIARLLINYLKHAIHSILIAYSSNSKLHETQCGAVSSVVPD